MQDELLAEHGGLSGIRDEAAFEASLARARNKFCSEGAGPFTLAAAFGFALARSHPFHDGNRRVALACVDVFVRLNGHTLTATEVDAVSTFVRLAAGEVSEADLAAWIERNSAPRVDQPERASRSGVGRPDGGAARPSRPRSDRRAPAWRPERIALPGDVAPPP